jgi:arsenate reductase
MKKVLFLCIKNSSRSQIAEAILNSKAGDRFEAYSAGSKPANQVNPFAVKIMQEVDVDLSEKKPESAEKYLDVKFDFVITLCDKMKEECPNFPGDPIVAHWGMPDPDEKEGSEEEKIKEFRKTRNEILNRINLFINLPMEKLDRLTMESKTKEIGTNK